MYRMSPVFPNIKFSSFAGVSCLLKAKDASPCSMGSFFRYFYDSFHDLGCISCAITDEDSCI